MGARVVKALGYDGAADVAACLRGKSMNEVVSAVPGNFSVLPRAYGPNVDGYLFPDQPIKLIEHKQYPAMPVIIGNTAEETLGWADTAGQVVDEASYSAAVDKVFGAPARGRILALYPASAFPSPRRAFAQVTTDAEFTCKSRRVARTFADAQKEPVYRYLFNHRVDNDPTQRRSERRIRSSIRFFSLGREVTGRARRIARCSGNWWTIGRAWRRQVTRTARVIQIGLPYLQTGMNISRSVPRPAQRPVRRRPIVISGTRYP
jgi:hypothetical protein